MCDRPAEKAVRSPWTEGAWIMLASEAVTRRWQARWGTEQPWEPCVSVVWSEPDAIVEARPTPQEDQ